MIKVKLQDSSGTQTGVRVSDSGQIVTAPFAYSTPIATTLDVAGQAYNVINANTGSRIVITDVVIYGNKNVGAGDATFDLYEASAADSTTIDKSILKLEIVKQNPPVTLTGLNLITSVGVFINAKTDDDDIFLMVGAYFIPDTDRITEGMIL